MLLGKLVQISNAAVGAMGTSRLSLIVSRFRLSLQPQVNGVATSPKHLSSFNLPYAV